MSVYYSMLEAKPSFFFFFTYLWITGAMLKKEIDEEKEKKKEQNFEKEIFLYFFWLARLSFIVNALVFKENSILMSSSLIFILKYFYNNMSGRGIQFNPALINARTSNSTGQPIAVPESDSTMDILDSFTYPRPGFPPMTHVQKRMREAEDMETDEASLSFSIYMDLKKEIYSLKEMLRKEQEEKQALQGAYTKLKEAYDELEAESGKGAKPIATAVKVRTLKTQFHVTILSAFISNIGCCEKSL